MGWSVVLRHNLPDGSSHLDWFIDPIDEISPADPSIRRLLSFRVDCSPLARETRVVRATPTPAHRVYYLNGEGPVQNGRLGSVRRLARAWALIRGDREQGWLQVELHDAPSGVRPLEDSACLALWRGVPTDAGQSALWRFTRDV